MLGSWLYLAQSVLPLACPNILIGFLFVFLFCFAFVCYGCLNMLGPWEVTLLGSVALLEKGWPYWKKGVSV